MGTSRQYALIAYLAERQGRSGRLGKKAVQKFVHILSSVSGKTFGYRFSFYTYGPFSSTLAADLDIANALGLVKVSYNSQENSYSVTETGRTEAFVAANLPLVERRSIDKVWDRFSGKSAKELELISTILFLYDEEGLSGESAEMRQRVLELKPKYTSSEVKRAQSELSDLYDIN
ncbi:hypothetical protein [Mesorhizobium sp. B4-1-1]|uniref:hypothetical protein n=1 Tax=Mesorhizobium sp. B4-1-1 TaxID=2589890 RepID=UPI00112CCF53|nr:hypothetical protein [Mesorhizobium sp. B4-1-1]TPI13567.1 hypothetical protein FJW10_26300 [Mesorhizobium sp. B4-1-1]